MSFENFSRKNPKSFRYLFNVVYGWVFEHKHKRPVRVMINHLGFEGAIERILFLIENKTLKLLYDNEKDKHYIV